MIWTNLFWLRMGFIGDGNEHLDYDILGCDTV
jgi:hypothetical protein